MKLSINCNIINKNETNAHQSKGFEPFDLTPQQLADHIQQGHAFSFQYKNSYRKADNFICTDVIAADIDDGMTLDEALADEFIINNACLIYTTPSHTADAHRFRVVFHTPHTITDRATVQAALRGLIRKLPCDRSVKDGARQLYGSRDCETHVFDNVLSDAEFEMLIDLGKPPLDPKDSIFSKTNAGVQADLCLPADQQVMTANGEIQLLHEMENSQPIYCPFHRDSKPSAFTTQSRHGIIGIHCSVCLQTFWPKEKLPPKYDFYAFDKIVEEQAALPPEQWLDEPGVLAFETPNPHRILTQQYLSSDDIPLFDGITLIKSPKGSGKTQYLEYLVDHCKRSKLRVLLVGHRRALLRSLAARLGLAYYGDSDKAPTAAEAKYYAISVDSLAIRLDPQLHKFNVVLIDESEQVFSHILSETMDNDTRRRSYLLLQHYVQTARQVVALDADLNEVTLHAIQRLSEKNPFLDRRFILNRYTGTNKSVELYADENHLIEDLFVDIAAGKRVFVCCNTKTRVEALTHAILDKLGESFPVLSITSANSDSDTAKAFLSDPPNETLKYRVILVSPAVGTGIDITFPETLTHIDAVYGLFQPLINTHYDIDQQLSRVRHPGSVRIWVTPQKFQFETEVEPILQELATSGEFPQTMKGYTRKGAPIYDWGDPYLRLYATILSSQRASKNDLKANFAQLRQYNGWTITEVDRDKLAAARGKEIASTGSQLRFKKIADDMLATDLLDAEEVDHLLKIRDEQKQKLSRPQQLALERYFLEQFYHQPVSMDLLVLDNESHYRDQIKMLEDVLSYDAASLKNVKTNTSPRLLYELLFQAGVISGPHTINRQIVLRANGLTTFAEFCANNKAHIERIFPRIDIRRDVRQKPMAQLNAFLRLCGLCTVKTKTISTTRNKIYEHQLAPAALDTAFAVIDRRKKHRLASKLAAG